MDYKCLHCDRDDGLNWFYGQVAGVKRPGGTPFCPEHWPLFKAEREETNRIKAELEALNRTRLCVSTSAKGGS